MRLRSIPAIAAAMLAISLFAAEKDWYNSKAFENWSDKEVQWMLSKSPWVRTHAHIPSGASAQGIVTTGAAQRGGGGGAQRQQGQVRNNMRFRWFSARPVRMAIAKLAMSNNPEMTADRLEAFVSGDMPDIVLTLSVDSSQGRRGSAMLERALRSAETDQIAGETSLKTKSGKEIPFKEYRPPSDDGLGAKFIFERAETPLTLEDKELRFSTKLKLARETLRVRLKYKLKDMVYQGQLEY